MPGDFLPSEHFFAGLRRNHYRFIYIDPPWKFSSGPSRNPSRHYQTMSVKDIMAMPVRDLASPEGCRLAMWITVPLMDRTHDVLKSWGFRYSSARFWGKLWPSDDGLFVYPDSMARGTGYEVIGNVEILVIGKRGKAPKINGNKPGSLFFGQRREHSRKPDFLRDEALRLYPGPHCEVFARTTHVGWDVWGNEINKFSEAAE